ncbi:TPA: hypothetical protein RQN23_002916 [Aeromonas veronii]|nr:hypothetical protein [Aeromonas veronii]
MDVDDVRNLLSRLFRQSELCGSIHLFFWDFGDGQPVRVFAPHAKGSSKSGTPQAIDAISSAQADALFKTLITELNFKKLPYDRGVVQEALVFDKTIFTDTVVHGIYHPQRTGRTLTLTKDLSDSEREQFNKEADRLDTISGDIEAKAATIDPAEIDILAKGVSEILDSKSKNS